MPQKGENDVNTYFVMITEVEQTWYGKIKCSSIMKMYRKRYVPLLVGCWSSQQFLHGRRQREGLDGWFPEWFSIALSPSHFSRYGTLTRKVLIKNIILQLLFIVKCCMPIERSAFLSDYFRVFKLRLTHAKSYQCITECRRQRHQKP